MLARRFRNGMVTFLHEHLVVVEAYDGLLEFCTDEPDERAAARGLGFPLREIREALRCRITLLTWDDWLAYEESADAFLHWPTPPFTRPLKAPGPPPPIPEEAAGGVVLRAIPAHDPDFRMPFSAAGCSPRMKGLLAQSDPLFAYSWCLERYLIELYRTDPFDLVLLPMWGGLGFVAQLARATGCSPLASVRFAVLVTDVSRGRQAANQEGLWTRPALTRRQSEDMSLALADGVFVLGERGMQIGHEGRPAEAPTAAPAVRSVPEAMLNAVAAAAETAHSGPLSFFLHGPKQAASGTLAALDSLAALRERGRRLDRPLTCSGTNMITAPMMPRDFVGYWSSRGFVRELVADNQWAWAASLPKARDELQARLYPSRFDHLPCIWPELGRGSMAVLSAAAAEGLAPGEALPPLSDLGEAPSAARLADALQAIMDAGPEKVDAQRRALCKAVLAAHRGPARESRFAAMVDALGSLLRKPRGGPHLAAAARLLLDRRRPLIRQPALTPAEEDVGELRKGAVTVVVVCHEMGELVGETVRSVWAARPIPDEVLLVDDGSYGSPTLSALADLKRQAAARKLPLKVIRQRNTGLAKARNAGLSGASCEFISFIDGDDLIEPEFYGWARAVLEKHPGLGGVAAWAETFGENVAPGFWNAPQPEFPLLLVENTVFVPCMVRTALLRALGGYDPGQRYNYEDWELSVRLLARGYPIVTIPRYLQRYRVRGDSMLRMMTVAQNQVMRSHLLEKHRATAEAFAPEVALLLEGRSMSVATQPSVEASRLGALEFARRVPGGLRRRVVRRVLSLLR